MTRSKVCIGILAVLMVFTSCTNQSGTRKDPLESTAPSQERVRTLSLNREEISRSVEYSSTLQPFEEIHLAPASPGKIETIHVDISDRVRQGDLLITMDDAQLIQSKIQLNNLEVEKKRLEELRKTGSIAQQQYDQLNTQYESVKENVEFLAENIHIHAPFSGIVSGRYFESGEIYSGAPNTTAGKAAILTIIQVDQLKAVVSISEKYVPNIHKNMKVVIQADVYPDLEFSGEILRVYPTINPQTRTFNVEIGLNNPSGQLRPGMFARVTIDIGKTEVLILPSIAILKMQGSNVRYLFVAENNKAKRIEVTTGKRFDDKVEVISDELKVGDAVIVSGQARLLDGMEITVVQ
jgi:membrane fusion protein, multidrug efflux system